MAEPGVPVPSRRTLLACTGAACAAVLAGCARGSASSGGMAASQPAQGNSATGPAWASRAAAGLEQPVLGQPASGQSASAQPASGQSASAQPPSLARASDVPVGGGTILTDKKIVITQPRAGSFKAFTAVCTHQGCTVSSVSGGTINCPCHGSRFSLTNGSVVQGPAPSPLAPVSIKVHGTAIVQA
jgi:Rieske Fe-S protein